MRHHIPFHPFLSMALFLAMSVSCTEEIAEDMSGSCPDAVVDDSNLAEVRLSLDVADMGISSSVGTRAGSDIADEEERQGTDAERKIDNIWVFQFDDVTGRLLITPRYYDISDRNVSPTETRGVSVDVLLKPDVKSTVHVVANTGNSSWATVGNSATLDAVQKLTLPDPKYVAVPIGGTVSDLSIPMEGGIQGVSMTRGSEVSVTVTRMYAKVEILVEDIPETIVITDVNVSQIPYYCRVKTLASEDDPVQAVSYPIGHNDWNSYAYSPGTKDGEGRYTGKMTIYLPENLQGRTDSADPSLKSENVPNDNALRVDFVANYIDIFTGDEKERGRHYAVYPGANNYNDYNIKRNCIYRVSLNIYTDQYDQDIPSSNCFVVKPGHSISFLPYYRTEVGGGHKFTDYLDADGNDDSKMINDSDDMLKNIRIIWQTKDAIGDNSNGDLVWIDRRSEVTGTADHPAEFYRKIHVKTGKKGNALIAACNSSGDIVWSWHIWVTENEPANVSSAVVYSTYAWNEKGIVNTVRVPGYAIMPCNLGALAYEPEGGESANNDGTYEHKNAPETHGMLYQWGRKDPFPPSIISNTGASVNYDDKSTGRHYANDNSKLVGKTSKTDAQYLFHSALIPEIEMDKVPWSVRNPTVFICGTKEADQTSSVSEGYVGSRSNYVARGDWQMDHDETLWGGLKPAVDGSMKFYSLNQNDDSGNPMHIFDNYGDQKSIYDPCPSGWRVPPGDLWLGFTEDGLNPVNDAEYYKINTSTEQRKSMAGMYMYMNGWKTGTTVFFPTQGTRIADGRIIRSNSCGNYHNATTDAVGESQRVNILHIHNSGGLFRVFEFRFYMYYVKSTAGPIRCVRDHK